MDQTVRVGNRTAYEWIMAIPAFLVLVFVIIINTSHTLHAQLLQLGETTWEGYFQLRHDPVEPSCNANMDIEAELQRLIAEREAEPVDEFDLFAPEPINPDIMRTSLTAAKEQCVIKYEQYDDVKDRITTGVEIFRTVELGVARFGEFGMATQRIMLSTLVLICGLTTLLRRHHIALRPMETVMDYRLGAIAQLRQLQHLVEVDTDTGSMTRNNKVSTRDDTHLGIQRNRQCGFGKTATGLGIFRYNDGLIQAEEHGEAETDDPVIMQDRMLGADLYPGTEGDLLKGPHRVEQNAHGEKLRNGAETVVHHGFHRTQRNMMTTQQRGQTTEVPPKNSVRSNSSSTMTSKTGLPPVLRSSAPLNWGLPASVSSAWPFSVSCCRPWF